MTRLVILRLNGNKIRDVYPLHKLPTIRFLELQDNAIKDVRPLGEVPTLMHLDLARNRITDFPCVCGGLRGLKKLASLILQGAEAR
jgi:Leucine-rich repeat (LRR) protein